MLANKIITNPTTPVIIDVIRIANDAKNKIRPTFLEFFTTNGIIITKKDKRPDNTQANMKIPDTQERSSSK